MVDTKTYLNSKGKDLVEQGKSAVETGNQEQGDRIQSNWLDRKQDSPCVVTGRQEKMGASEDTFIDSDA